MPRGKQWRVLRPCADCPFSDSPKGRHLRESLRPGRWAEIHRSLLAGDFFTCHKTGKETGDGSQLVCAGSIEWQAERGIEATYVQICRRLEWMRERRKRDAPKP